MPIFRFWLSLLLQFLRQFYFIQETFSFYVHYFKGAARQLSAETLAQTGQELEDILRNKKTGSLEELNKKFYLDYQNAYKAFTHALEIL